LQCCTEYTTLKLRSQLVALRCASSTLASVLQRVQVD
jgi:hypothetical protein